MSGCRHFRVSPRSRADIAPPLLARRLYELRRQQRDNFAAFLKRELEHEPMEPGAERELSPLLGAEVTGPSAVVAEVSTDPPDPEVEAAMCGLY